MTFEGILLAAGESRRMGYPKPLLEIGAKTYVAHLASAMLPAVSRLIVVIGAYADRVRPAIPPDPRIVIIENSAFKRGQLSSLKAGLGAISAEAAAVMVHLIDHPTVQPITFKDVVTSYDDMKKAIIIARYSGRRGHPVVFARALFEELLEAPDELGARSVVNADPTRVGYFDVDDRGILLDLDTPTDVAAAGLHGPVQK